MPKSETTVQIRSDSSTPVRILVRRPIELPAVKKAYQNLIATLAAEAPHDIVGGWADRADIETRQEHLKAVLDAVATYAEWIVSDTAENAPLGYLRNETGYLRDAIGEIDGAFDSAVDRMGSPYIVAAE